MAKTDKNKRKMYRESPQHYPEVTFMDHVRELRHRLSFVAIGVILGSTIAYFIEQQIVNWLLKPSHGQHFIFTSPTGGIGFLFNVCLYGGIVFSIPVIVYQLLGFLEPIIKTTSKKTLVRYSMVSGGLALAGIIMGYTVGLPVALNFLSHQFTNKQIQPLFTISEYLSFVTFYLLGTALLFQIPLVINLIDKIKPLKPKKLLHYERYVIAGAFIVSALMAPTINLFNQLIIAGPIVLMYQLAIVMVWLKNRSTVNRYSSKIRYLVQQDEQARVLRSNISLRPLAPSQSLINELEVADSLKIASVVENEETPSQAIKPRKVPRLVIDDFRSQPYAT